MKRYVNKVFIIAFIVASFHSVPVKAKCRIEVLYPHMASPGAACCQVGGTTYETITLDYPSTLISRDCLNKDDGNFFSDYECPYSYYNADVGQLLYPDEKKACETWAACGRDQSVPDFACHNEYGYTSKYMHGGEKDSYKGIGSQCSESCLNWSNDDDNCHAAVVQFFIK